MLSKKRHEYDKFFYGLVLAKSNLLKKFVNEHPAGPNYARKKIISAKYELSKLHPILRGFFIRALHKPSQFTIETEQYLTSSIDIGVSLEIDDNSGGGIQFRVQDKKIMMENGRYQLTSEPHDIMIYRSVFEALTVKKNNEAIIDFNVKQREKIDSYMRRYGSEYP